MLSLLFRLAATVAAFAARLRPHTTGPPLDGPRLVVPLPALGPGAHVEIGLAGSRPAVRLVRAGAPASFAHVRLAAGPRHDSLPPRSSAYDDGLGDAFADDREADDEFAAGYDDELLYGRYDDVDSLGAGGPFGYGAPPRFGPPPGYPGRPPAGQRGA